MIIRDDLQEWVIRALRDSGGRARLIDVAKHIWQHHSEELKNAGDLFYTWQYDMRWAATKLRKKGQLKPDSSVSRGVWQLT